MSNARYMQAVQEVAGLRAPLKHVLLALAVRCGNEGTCYPSEGRLADDTGMHRRSIGKLLHELESLRLVARVGQRRSRHGRSVLVRQLDLAALQALAEPGPQSGYPVEGDADNPALSTPKPGPQYPITRPSVPDNPAVGRIELPEELPRELPEELPISPAAEAACESRAGYAPAIDGTHHVHAGDNGNGSDPPGFAEFFDIYPRQVARTDAVKAYRRATRDVAPEKVLAALQQQLPGLLARQERFRPHPATWLKGRRWEDLAEQPARPQSPWLETRESARALMLAESGGDAA